MQTGSFQWMKSINKSLILNKIRTQGPISRAQIAKDTKLTPPTVGSIVKELIGQGIVKESVQGTSQGGRKPTMLVINNSEFFVIGVDAGPRNVMFVLSDLSGMIIDQQSTEIMPPISKKQFLDILKTGIKDLLDRYYYIRSKITGIGVAMHGVVEVKSGISLFAPNLSLRNIPIKDELESEFDLMVNVENDARAMALGEAWFVNSQESNVMVAVNIGRGIGAGIVINGQLYHGEYDLAGEIGHMTIDINGKQCECGNYGCLQTVASGPAIAERTVDAISSETSSKLTEMVDGDLTKITGELVYQAAVAEDDLAIEILDETAHYLGVGLTNLIHIVNPSKIVIGGGVSRAKSFILDRIITTINQRALTTEAKKTEVVISKLEEQATVLGAVSLILVELFNPTTNVIKNG